MYEKLLNLKFCKLCEYIYLCELRKKLFKLCENFHEWKRDNPLIVKKIDRTFFLLNIFKFRFYYKKI